MTEDAKGRLESAPPQATGIARTPAVGADLQSLLERVKAASGPDRELDTALWLAFTPGATYRKTHVKHARSPAEWDIEETRIASGLLVTVPAFTASLDAALALVERVLPGWGVFVGDLDPTDRRAVATLAMGYPDQLTHRGFAPPKQYALALLAALLSALIARGDA